MKDSKDQTKSAMRVTPQLLFALKIAKICLRSSSISLWSGGWVRVYNRFSSTVLQTKLQSPPGSPVNRMATSVAYGNDQVTSHMIFVGGEQTAYNVGRVFFYKGMYTTWWDISYISFILYFLYLIAANRSVQQELFPPLSSGFGEQNDFGGALALDHDHMRLLAVGCSMQCNPCSRWLYLPLWTNISHSQEMDTYCHSYHNNWSQ
jgi:hypothetical protein